MALIRNNKDVSPAVRDPEAVLSRLGHFWDSHGLSKQVLDPRGPFFNKQITFVEDSAPVPDLKPNMPSSPNDATISYSKLSTGMEGGLSTREMEGLRMAVFKRGPRGEDLSESDEDLLNGIDLLSPVHIQKFSDSPVSLNTSHGIVWRDVPSRHVHASGSRSDFWNEYVNHIKDRQSAFTKGGHGVSHSWVTSNINPLRDTKGYDEGLRNFDALSIIKPLSENPNHVSVRFGIGGEIFDRIDLNTGTWARLNRDEFFPS